MCGHGVKEQVKLEDVQMILRLNDFFVTEP